MSVFDGTTTVNWRKGKAVDSVKCGETDMYGDIFKYDTLPSDGENYCEEALCIPEHVLVHEDEFLVFKDKERDRSRWRGIQNWVDKGQKIDKYVQLKGWYRFDSGGEVFWFSRLSEAMVAYDSYFSVREPISMARRDDYNFPDSVSCILVD